MATRQPRSTTPTPTANPTPAATEPHADTHDARVHELKQQLLVAMDGEIQQLATLLANMNQQCPFGQVEFDLRDIAHRLVSAAHQVALDGDKKRGTKGPRSHVPTVPARATATLHSLTTGPDVC